MAAGEKRSLRSEGPGQYLYAVVPAEAVGGLDLEVRGVDGAPIHPIVSGSVAAIASDVVSGRLRPERKNLAAHSAVLRRLLDRTHLLPAAFLAVAAGEGEVRDLLAAHECEMREQLERVEGCVEMELRGTLRVPDLVRFFLERCPDLRRLRDETFATGEPTREEKIELGLYCADTLQAFRDEFADAVVRGLAPTVRQVRENEPRTEQEVLHLALLVPRDGIETLSAALRELAPELDEAVELELSGPWPPWNFVDLRIRTEEEREGAP